MFGADRRVFGLLPKVWNAGLSRFGECPSSRSVSKPYPRLRSVEDGGAGSIPKVVSIESPFNSVSWAEGGSFTFTFRSGHHHQLHE